MAIRIYRQATRAKRILKVCLTCRVLMFCRSENCPVCNTQLGVASEKQGHHDFPTLDSAAGPAMRLNPEDIAKQLNLGPVQRRRDLKYVNVGADPIALHFLERQKRLGVCDFCQIIQVGKAPCCICLREKRYILNDVDCTLQQNRNLSDATSEFQALLEELRLAPTQLLTLVRIHSFGDFFRNRSDILTFKDLIIMHDLEDGSLAEFLRDAKELALNCTLEEFSDVILWSELKRAKLARELFEQAWASDHRVSRALGPFPADSWLDALKATYSSDYRLFQAGIEAAQEFHKEEKQRRKIQRAVEEAAARSAQFASERLQSESIKEVSDWWLYRVEDSMAPKHRPSYAPRSWKNRWRKPW